MKTQRWYEIEGDKACVYDAPWPAQAGSVSVVSLSDLHYYRSLFHLEPCWASDMEVK